MALPTRYEERLGLYALGHELSPLRNRDFWLTPPEKIQPDFASTIFKMTPKYKSIWEQMVAKVQNANYVEFFKFEHKCQIVKEELRLLRILDNFKNLKQDQLQCWYELRCWQYAFPNEKFPGDQTRLREAEEIETLTALKKHTQQLAEHQIPLSPFKEQSEDSGGEETQEKASEELSENIRREAWLKHSAAMNNILQTMIPHKKVNLKKAYREISRCFSISDSFASYKDYVSSGCENWCCLCTVFQQKGDTEEALIDVEDVCGSCDSETQDYCLQTQIKSGVVQFKLVRLEDD